MRSFVATILIFIFVCGIIVVNNRYVKDCASYICECVSEESFYNDPNAAVNRLEDFWEKNHPFIGLSVGFKELDRMSELIIELKSYTELGNTSEIKRLRMLIIDSADDISRLEKFDIENLL